jgi:membrane protein
MRAATASWTLIRESFTSAWNDGIPRLGAALAYYTVFSLAPTLILLVVLVGAIWGEGAAREQISQYFSNAMGPSAGGLVKTLLENARESARGASVFGVAALLVGATAAMGELQAALNAIWGHRYGEQTWKAFLRKRAFSFLVVLGISAVLLVSLLAEALLPTVNDLVNRGQARLGLPFGDLGIRLIGLGSSLAVGTLLFALIFKVLPDARLSWRDVGFGAFMTAVLFSLGKMAIGLYLSQSATASLYGAAGSAVALLVWVYYSAQIVLLGAEFTKAFARHYGSQAGVQGNLILLKREAERRRSRDAG